MERRVNGERETLGIERVYTLVLHLLAPGGSVASVVVLPDALAPEEDRAAVGIAVLQRSTLAGPGVGVHP